MDRDEIKIHAFRLKPGQDLKKELQAFVQQADIQAGWIVSCVGGLTQTHIRFANQPEGAKAQGHFEIVSLVSTFSKNGSRVHLSVSDSLGQTIGGHVWMKTWFIQPLRSSLEKAKNSFSPVKKTAQRPGKNW